MHDNTLFAALAAVTALTFAGAAMAQDTPFAPRPITVVAPTPPGGGTDVLARLFAEKLGKSLHQTVIVDNRAGANGIIGTDFVAKGPADGTRILFTYAATIVINPALYKKLPYDPLKDLIPVAQVGRGGNLMLVKKDLPVSNIKEFVAYAKANPGKLSYCSWGNGSGGHLTMENFKKQAGLDITHVPYKGAAPCTQDLMGGQVDASFADAATTTEAVKSGRIKAMAYSGATRLPALPDVPTLNEAGFPFKNYTWYGVFLPAKTPPALVKRLNEAINSAQKDPAVVKRLNELNLTDIPLVTPEQFAATVKQDLQDWSVMVKSVGVTLD
jgi:tripartite-type tricarboxylate transporter receptor subunit TctC